MPRDDREVGRERREGHLEPDLVVSLASAAMGERIGADATRDLDLPLGDERTRHRGAEQVLPVVDRARTQRREDEVADELLAEILDVALFRAGGDRLVAHAAQLFTILTDVGGHADHPRVVVLAKPRNDDRRVETTGVRENDGARHGLLLGKNLCSLTAYLLRNRTPVKCGSSRVLRRMGSVGQASPASWRNRSASAIRASGDRVTISIVSSPAMVPSTSGNSSWSIASAMG